MGDIMGNKVDITDSTDEQTEIQDTKKQTATDLNDTYDSVINAPEISEKVEEILQQLHDIGKYYDILNPGQKKALTEVMQGMQQDLEEMMKILEEKGDIISTKIDVHNEDAMKQTADRIMETLDVNGFNAMLDEIKNAMDKASSHPEISVAVLKFQDEISTIWNGLARQINHGPYDM